jgi:hypothetical protein
MTPAHSLALSLRSQGISAIPVKPGPEKKPALRSWKKYQTENPTDAELGAWFANGDSVAVVAGEVQCLDIDQKHAPVGRNLIQEFCERAKAAGLGDLLVRLVCQTTVSGGAHFVWRCGSELRNLKLASLPSHETLIETRGDGGYFLVAPSPGYALVSGSFARLPILTEDERDDLLSVARSFDESTKREAASKPAPGLPGALSPCDDYDLRADVPELLRAHGWTPAGGKHWTRPGKARGVSASWDVVPGRFWVFSSSTQFEPQHLYRPYAVFAMLECGGDFAEAARRLRRMGYGDTSPRKDHHHDGEPGGMGLAPEAAGIETPKATGTAESEDQKILAMLAARAFDPHKEPPPTVPVYSLAGICVCTAGNLTAVTAQAKVGKSAFLGAMLAAAMHHEDHGEADLLGVTGANADGKAVLHFDTEQSRDDFWRLVDRSRKRARTLVTPDWLHAYSVADLPVRLSRKAIRLAMEQAAAVHGGIHSVFLDGVADFVCDVNDAEECNGFVAELHALAIAYSCPIICVIHLNPGGEKERGHLGSQLVRKAESNLKLEKDGDVSVVWSEKQRRAPIFKDKGPRFSWSEELMMHASVDAPKRTSKKVNDLRELAVEIFEGAPRMRFMEVAQAVSKARDLVLPTAKRRVSEMLSAEVIQRAGLGFYELTPNP